MFSLRTAYLLWLVGGFGAFGLHRFYLRKFGSGMVWFLSGGLGWIFGAVQDLFRMPWLVEQANALLTYREDDDGARLPGQRPELPSRAAAEPVERAALRVAKRDGGTLTPATVADGSSCTLQEARAELDRWVSAGHAEIRATRDGNPATVYVVPEFLTAENKARLEP
jgi:hypothetical protein